MSDHQVFSKRTSEINISNPLDEFSQSFTNRNRKNLTTNHFKEPDNTENFPATPNVSVEWNSQIQRADVRETSKESKDKEKSFLNGNASNDKNEEPYKNTREMNVDFVSLGSRKASIQIDSHEIFKQSTATFRNLQSDAVSKTPKCRVCDLLIKIRSVNGLNCHHRPKSDLILSSSVSYGIESQFEPQARTALRLAHFLSNYYQNADMAENFGILKGGKPLHQDLLFGEVLANVMADNRILSSGVFFDEYQFLREDGFLKKLFGPWAFKNATGFWAIDASGLSKNYKEEYWFKAARHRYKSSSTFGLQRYLLKPYVRTDVEGSSNIRFMYHSIPYMAPKLSSGQWHQPKFRCDGMIDEWVITFTVPFFGSNRIQNHLQFL